MLVIYGNYIANCFDDGIESEGDNTNVRIWNNYIEEVFLGIGNAATSIGPLYVWRNVTGRAFSHPGSTYGDYGGFMKMGYGGGPEWMTGHMYIFNNTILQVDNHGTGGLGTNSIDDRHILHCETRNNIFNVRSATTSSISIRSTNHDNDYDYDLTNRPFPSGHESNGLTGTPTYSNSGPSFNFNSKTGNFTLDSSSLGYDKGIVIPNFIDNYSGSAPDMGAHEHGTGNIVYGVNANFVPKPETPLLTYSLPNESWHMITLPANPGSKNTVLDIFGDDISGEIKTDWAVYSFDSNTGLYDSKDLQSTLKPGVGYWIIQKSGSSVTLDMPAGSTALTDSSFSISLVSKANTTTWNMIGNPYASAISMDATRVKTTAGACTDDCTLDVSESNNIVRNQFWSYNGSSYVVHNTSSGATLNPWTGFWAVTLKEAEGKNPTIKFFKSSAKLNSIAGNPVLKSSNSRNLLEGATSNPGFPVFPVVSDDNAAINAPSMVHPNPSNGLFSFNFSSVYKGEVSLTVHNLLGKLIKELKLQKNETDFTQKIDLTNQASGLYIINFKAGDYQKSHQVMKE